jgi:predicted TIM-barrel fold metal-dependent hydrolase
MPESRYARNILEGRPPGFPILDCHAHLGTFMTMHIPCDADLRSLLAMMDLCGTETVCLSHNAAITADVVAGNRLACGAAAEHPGRIGVYLGFNPNYPPETGLADIEEHSGKKGVVGIKLHPSSHQAATVDPRYYPAYEYARRHRWIVLSHTWGVADIKGIEHMARRYPEVPILMGHSGGYEFAAIYEAMRVARECPNAFLDLTLSGHFEGLVEVFVKDVGADKVLFGSDVPFLDPRGSIGRVVFARIPDADKEKILGNNMRGLLQGRLR